MGTAVGLKGLRLAPAHTVLGNNLASVLGERGCPRAGEALLAPIAAQLPTDSPLHEAVAATLAELASTPGEDPARYGDESDP